MNLARDLQAFREAVVEGDLDESFRVCDCIVVAIAPTLDDLARHSDISRLQWLWMICAEMRSLLDAVENGRQ